MRLMMFWDTAVPDTRNVSVVKLSWQLSTPSSRATPFSTVWAQLAQSIPVTRKVCWLLIFRFIS
jgi:hypothetical protein